MAPGFVNITITAPNGTSQHGQEDLFCVPTGWSTILRFFVINYLAHALTIWIRPGEKISERLFNYFLAFIFPMSGLARGIDAIYRHASWPSLYAGFCAEFFGKSTNSHDIWKAARSGALAVVVRSLQDPMTDDSPFDFFVDHRDNWDGHTLHGVLVPARGPKNTTEGKDDEIRIITVKESASSPEKNNAPPPEDLRLTRKISGMAPTTDKLIGYHIVELPCTSADEIKVKDDASGKVTIAETSNAPTILLAILQISYASYEIARNRGDQFQRWGSSAFILTTIPYLAMSFVNLAGNLATPVYPSVYLVDTFVLKEATSRMRNSPGNVGTIGEIPDSTLEVPPEQYTVIPWNCRSKKPWNDQSNLTEPPTGFPRNLRICFSAHCRKEEIHQDVISVPSGQLTNPPKDDYKYPLKALILVLATAAPVAVIAYVGVNYQAPGYPVYKKVVLPLWLGFGDITGYYLMWKRLESDVLWEIFVCMTGGEMNGVQMESKAYIFWFAILVPLGLAVAALNFYLVIVQMLEFGDCQTMSDRR